MDCRRLKVKTIISIGNEQESIHMTFQSVVREIYDASSIEEAVNMASIIADENDLVLFSPACKDQEMDYAERGDLFITKVKTLNSKL